MQDYAKIIQKREGAKTLPFICCACIRAMSFPYEGKWYEVPKGMLTLVRVAPTILVLRRRVVEVADPYNLYLRARTLG